MLVALLSTLALAGYEDPPPTIARILDAPSPPSVSIGPGHAWMLELERPSLPPIAELAEPVVKVAGIRINPRTNGPAREYAYTGLTLRPFGPARQGGGQAIALPEGARVRNVDWSFEGDRFVFTLTEDEGVSLWLVDTASPTPRRLTEATLNAAYGAPCDWLPGDEGLICKRVPADRGPAPEADPVPEGPIVAESLGRSAPARTYTDLLGSPHDEALFRHYLLSELVHVGLDGTLTPLVAADLVDEAIPSPDGRYLLIETLHAPFSYSVPASRFPNRIEVLDRQTGDVALIEDLPLADAIPISYDSTRAGRRTVSWRADHPATLWWVEALDGGDAGAEAEWRDAVYTLDAPFEGDPALLARTELRFGGVTWGDDDLALLDEYWWATRRTRTWTVHPGTPDADPGLLFDRSLQDEYSDPGSPEVHRGPHGWSVLQLDAARRLTYTGRGASPEGIHPFLDRIDPATGDKERLWTSQDPYLEQVVSVLEDDAGFVTWRQSAVDVPNYFLRQPGKRRPTALTAFEDWAPEFARVEKRVITYTRADGLELSAKVYFPPGYDPRRDGPLPAVFWTYPSEFKSRADAAQVTETTSTFTRPGGISPLFLLLEGYLVVDDPKIPIIGEGDEEPNDTYVAQLVSGAEAAVEAVVSRGWADPDRLVVGGHSYGAFTTANLLAHTDLFRAGIARSGAYNRTLTPFSFQGEQRSYWEATAIYTEMSPFTHAASIDEPILLIHGMEDSNSGTFPIQSERLYEALKGLGGTVRWVQLPYESHGYRARESVGHTLWEMIRWCDTWAAPREKAD